MKKILLIVLVSISSLGYSQNPPVTSVINVASGLLYDEVPENSYFKDLFNTFDPFQVLPITHNSTLKVLQGFHVKDTNGLFSLM